MRDRKDTETDANQDKKQGLSSVAALKNRILASQAATANQQSTSTREELEVLRKVADKRQQLASPAAGTGGTGSSTQKAAEELKGLRLAQLRDQLFANKSATVNPQKQATEEDIRDLKAAEGNVRNKAKELEKYFQKSKQVLDVLQKNKSSEAARIKLTIPYELKIFEEQQVTFVSDIRVKLETDIVQYANSPKLQEMGYARFLELSFIFRSYEVCMEQELRRHAALTVKNNPVLNFMFDSPQDSNNNIAILCGIPTKMAVESLNYYQDFFNKLPEIEKIWPNAGQEIRKAEVRLIFAAAVYKDTKILSTILGDKNARAYRECCDVFEQALTQHIMASERLQDYIVWGNGLDAEKHPYALYRYNRLAQPNASINFSEIVAVDPVHADAIQQVQVRVAADTTMRK